MNDQQALQKVPLFSYMDAEEVAAIHSIMDADGFAPGEVIIREGERGDNFFVVVQGRVQFWVQMADGHEKLVDEVGPGGFFGELSMLTGEPRSARVQAIDAVKTLSLDRNVFLEFLESHPHAAIDVLKVLGQRLHRTDKLLRQSVSRNVNEMMDEQLTLGQKIVEKVAGFSGSTQFLMLHALWFSVWILWNQSWFPAPHFDSAPHDGLALLTGLEATLLSTFVLISQNRQEAKYRLELENDHQINTKAEIEIGLILRRLDDIERELHFHHNEQCALMRAGREDRN